MTAQWQRYGQDVRYFIVKVILTYFNVLQVTHTRNSFKNINSWPCKFKKKIKLKKNFFQYINKIMYFHSKIRWICSISVWSLN